ncbi:type II secretion system protein [Metabacillus sp. JX24]|uniref:type II secretion system protein n=1 Tax=Metabacillus sp. JX24 TaxID=3240759 RepID=UPI00350EE897
MPNLKNERGMTLVAVLLIMTMFSILGLAVMAASINNMKQVSKSEFDVKQTDIAEMGVVYYETQLKEFLSQHLLDSAAQNTLMNSLFPAAATKDQLIQSFKTQFPTKLNSLYKADPSLYSADGVLPEITVDSKNAFRIKIDSSGIIPLATCKSNVPRDSQCFEIHFTSEGYHTQKLEKTLKAVYSFSYSVNAGSISISTAPTSAPLYKSILDSIPGKNLRQCTINSKTNYLEATCMTDLPPASFPKINGISNSFIVFNNSANFQHLSHAVSRSTLVIYSKDSSNPATLGKLNPNGFIHSQIVIVGNAKLDDQIMKPVNSSIYITGDADLKGFSFKNRDSLTKVCVDGTITPPAMAAYEGVYSKKSNPSAYQNSCMGKSNTGGTTFLTINGAIITPMLEDKPVVTY